MQVINSSTLLLSGRRLEFPASVQVRLENSAEEEIQTLELLELFRVLPKKRVVALARWQGALVVAKLLFERGRWEEQLQREVEGVTALDKRGMTSAQ